MNKKSVFLGALFLGLVLITNILVFFIKPHFILQEILEPDFL